jgi:hypothetical protein
MTWVNVDCSINNNNCLTANEIYNLIENKFKITISLTTIVLKISNGNKKSTNSDII